MDTMIPSTGKTPNWKSIITNRIEAIANEPIDMIMFLSAGFRENRTHRISCIATASICLLSTWSWNVMELF